jgi:glutaredoxin/pyruvate-formate lyase-activating enzyme
MSITIFSATGCVRCKITRQFLKEHDLAFRDHDALGEGREVFKSFYQKNRRNIYRGPDGIEFPVYADGEVIRQGLPAVMAHLVAGPALNGFFKPGVLHGQWLDGIDISAGDPAAGEPLVEVLHYLKRQGFKLQIVTNGVHANLLQNVLERKLADRVIMEVIGPFELYDLLLEQPVDHREIEKSMALVATCDEYRFVTPIAPVVREAGDPGKISYITPEEVAAAAHLIQTATGDKGQPYWLRPFDPELADDQRLKTVEALAPNALFSYRTQARRHQVKTEIISSKDH